MASPRKSRKPDWKLLERRLGVPIGPCLRALISLSYRTDAASPGTAFEDTLQVTMGWIDPAGALEPAAAWAAPHRVRVIGRGHQLVAFGLLMEDPIDVARNSDERPVVYRAPKDLDDDFEPHVIAANLPAFLGLVAMVGVEHMSRSWTNARWTTLRKERLAADEAFATASSALCDLPGVSLPANARRVATAAPDLVGLPAKSIAGATPPPPQDGRRAHRRAAAAWNKGEVGTTIEHAREALSDPDYFVEATTLLARALLHRNSSGDREEARRSLLAVARWWLAHMKLNYEVAEWEELVVLLGEAGVPSSNAVLRKVVARRDLVDDKLSSRDFI